MRVITLVGDEVCRNPGQMGGYYAEIGVLFGYDLSLVRTVCPVTVCSLKGGGGLLLLSSVEVLQCICCYSSEIIFTEQYYSTLLVLDLELFQNQAMVFFFYDAISMTEILKPNRQTPPPFHELYLLHISLIRVVMK